MERLQMGNLVIRTSGEKLLIEIGGASQRPTELGPDDVTAMLTFLQAYQKDYSNRRVGFRLDISNIPVGQLDDFKIVARSPAGFVKLRPIDFSVTGLGAESVAYIGELGGSTSIVISFAGHTVELPARIIRGGESGARIALQFIGVRDENGKPKTPRELTRIFNALEALWLNQHLNLDWGVQQKVSAN